jgi:hypothetical protein
MARYPTVPNIEAAMPNYARAVADSVAFYQKLQSRPGLDMNAELAALKAQLQADFDAAP